MAGCQYCVHDHMRVEGYPGGCPFFGTAKAWTPGRAKAPDVLDVIRLADQQLERERAVWKLEQAAKEADERERRDRAWAKTRAVLDEILAEHHAAVAAQNEADLAKVHEIRDGQRAAEAHEQRERARRLSAKLDHR